MMKKTLKLRKKVLGEEHPDTLQSMNNVAYEVGELGRRQEAFEMMKKAY